MTWLALIPKRAKLAAGAALVAVALLYASFEAGQWAQRTETRAEAAEQRLVDQETSRKKINEIEQLDDDSRADRFDRLWPR